MSLSEKEQQALREIESSLLADDPSFGSVSGAQSPAGGGGLHLRGVALVVTGLVLLIGGVALSQVSLWFIALSIVGFLLMFGAGIWMLRDGSARDRRPSSSGQAPRMASRMEENFRQRFGH